MLFFLTFFKKIFLKDFIYFFRERKGGRRRGREPSMCERNIDQLPCTPLTEVLTGSQACALAWNRTSHLSVYGPALNPLSHISRGSNAIFYIKFFMFFLAQSLPSLKSRSNWYTYVETLGVRVGFLFMSDPDFQILEHRDLLTFPSAVCLA